MNLKLIYERKLGYWTFVWIHGKFIHKNQAEEIHVAAINPGVCIFLTWYSPTVGYGNIEDNDINRVFHLCFALDALISCITRVLAKKRNSIKYAQAHMRRHIQNLVNEVHKKTALWLTKTFDMIVLPKFNSIQMSHRQKRKINSKTVL